TATATTSSSFDNYRITNAATDSDTLLGITRWQWAIRTGNGRNARNFHRSNRRNFVAHHANDIRIWTDKHKSALLHLFRKIGVLSQKTITRMHSNGVGNFHRAVNGGNV